MDNVVTMECLGGRMSITANERMVSLSQTFTPSVMSWMSLRLRLHSDEQETIKGRKEAARELGELQSRRNLPIGC